MKKKNKEKILFYVSNFLDLVSEKNFTFQVNIKDCNLGNITVEKYKEQYSPNQLKTIDSL